jgi:ABC-type Na+ transport system ATPase subunit NatA
MSNILQGFEIDTSRNYNKKINKLNNKIILFQSHLMQMETFAVSYCNNVAMYHVIVATFCSYFRSCTQLVTDTVQKVVAISTIVLM